MADFLGNYQLLGEIGRGGMGIVYRAISPDNGKIVAIKKLLLEQIPADRKDEFISRFRREAYTSEKLKHPNIVNVLDIQVDNENCFYVMEFLSGLSLRQYLRNRGGKIAPGEFYSLLKQIGEALTYAHSMNIVHRDVKPDNIFILNDGLVKLTDFGIARAAEFEDVSLTKTGIMMGTLAYVSPEQLQDAKSVDHRADIFSLGVVAYEALSNHSPFTANGIAATIVKIISQEEKPLHLLDKTIAEQISSSVAKAMRKNARDRYRSVLEFVKDYGQSLSEQEKQIVLNPQTNSQGATPAVKQPTPVKTSFGLNPEDSFAKEFLKTEIELLAYQEPSDELSDLSSLRTEVGNEAIKQTSVGNDLINTRAENIRGNHDQVITPISPVIKPSPKPLGEILTPLTFISQQGNGQKLEEPAAIALHNERLAIADAIHRKISIYSYDGQNPVESLRFLFDVQYKPAKNVPEGSSRTNYGRLTRPGGLAFDMKGRLFACDASDPHVRIFDGQGLFLNEIRNVQAKVSGHSGITFDSAGLLYLSDSTNACVQVIQPETGVWLRSLIPKTSIDPGFAGQASLQSTNQGIQLPAGLAVDRKNWVYLADYGSSKILVFNKQGQFVRSFGEKGAGEGQLNIPRSVAVDDWDRVFVCDSFNNRISIFNTNGTFLESFGSKGNDLKNFSNPNDIAIDTKHGLVFICDRGNKRVSMLRLRLSIKE
jgi:serine/threonine protein kinase/sugar lactone lactonase YvrE